MRDRRPVCAQTRDQRRRRNSRCSLSSAGGPLDDENPQRELRIGLDTAGRLLEVVVLLWDDGEIEIIHAMKARAQYRRLIA